MTESDSMLTIEPITRSIGAEISGVDFSDPLSAQVLDQIYRALIDHLVIFVRGTDISPKAHLEFARSFGKLDVPHPHYPHVAGFERIVLLENDGIRPPDTASWHTDLTFKAEQPFASILIARLVPKVGGDTMWSSACAAYDRLPAGLRADLESVEAVHDYGDFRIASRRHKAASRRRSGSTKVLPVLAIGYGRSSTHTRSLDGSFSTSMRPLLRTSSA